MSGNTDSVVLGAVRAALARSDAPLLLAVSGGLDSMALLAAVVEVSRARVAAVASFDHATGDWSRAAARHVRETAQRLGVPVVSGVSAARVAEGGRRRGEAEWRRERWRFLRGESARLAASVATAHTEDDQVETVLMRVLRGAGARGLAALYAPSPVVRPFLGVRRSALRAFATRRGLRWMEDPSNVSRAHLRNRVRHDLLPALRRVHAGVDAELLEVARRAARWRAEVEARVDAELAPRAGAGFVEVGAAELERWDADSLLVFWPAVAARAGLALDASGTRRLVEFTRKQADAPRAPRVLRVPLAGGWCAERGRTCYILERERALTAAVPVPESGTVSWGEFRFTVREGVGDASPWSACVPGGRRLEVRSWRGGDRLSPADGRPRRRVKRYLTEARLHGRERRDWPVLADGEEVLWIPGVRRSDAATDRSGRPSRQLVCERVDR